MLSLFLVAPALALMEVTPRENAPDFSEVDAGGKSHGQDVSWLTVVSSAKGKRGYLKPTRALEVAEGQELNASASFPLDTDGSVGRAYGAKTTPHMFVINPQGEAVYAGAVDDNDSANPAVIPDSNNDVAAALDASLRSEAVSVASSRAYGCRGKY